MDEISPETIRKTFLSIGYYHPINDALNLNAELDEVSKINLLIPNIIIDNNPPLKESMYEHYDEDNLDDNNYTRDNESDDDTKNRDGPTCRKMPTADDLSSGSDTMSEDECNKLIKKQFIEV
jgi:hypothetical protein